MTASEASSVQASSHSSLLMETSYAMRFSHSVSLSFLVYSRLCTRPQTLTLVPTSKLEANRALRPQLMQGM